MREKAVYEQAHDMFNRGEIAVETHEAYGELILRYARVCGSEPTSRTVKVLLLEYLSLVNPRPSELHSRVLAFAVEMARMYPDFDFARFLDMWGPQQFRPEDFVARDNRGSLVARAFELVVESSHVQELPYMLDLLPCSKGERMSLMREVFDNLVERKVKEGDTDGAIDLLEAYASHSSLHGTDEHHSRLLSMAMKVMKDGQRARFVPFFAHWNLALMRPEDFRPSTGQDGAVKRSLVSRAISYCFDTLKVEPERYFASMPALLENIDSLPRDKVSAQVIAAMAGYRAMLLSWTAREDEARDYMARQAASGRRDAAFWTQYASMASTPALALSRLALGVLRCGDNIDDTSRADLMLTLAHSLHIAGYEEAAAAVLSRYDSDCRAGMAAEPQSRYGAVKMSIDTSGTGTYDNELLCNRLAADALDDIFYNLPTIPMCVTAKDGNLITVSSSTSLPAIIDTLMWPALHQSAAGDTIYVKRHAGEVVMARAIGDKEPYTALKPCAGIAIDQEHISLRDYSQPIKTQSTVVTGRCYLGHLALDYKGDRYVVSPREIDVKNALDSFSRATAAVYEVTDKSIGVITEDWHAEMERSVLPGVNVGEVLKVHYYIDSHRNPVIVNAYRPTKGLHAGDLIVELSGPLELTADGWRVRDAIVDTGMAEQSGLEAGTYVKCRAMRHPGGTLHTLSLTDYSSL